MNRSFLTFLLSLCVLFPVSSAHAQTPSNPFGNPALYGAYDDAPTRTEGESASPSQESDIPDGMVAFFAVFMTGIFLVGCYTCRPGQYRSEREDAPPLDYEVALELYGERIEEIREECRVHNRARRLSLEGPGYALRMMTLFGTEVDEYKDELAFLSKGKYSPRMILPWNWASHFRILRRLSQLDAMDCQAKGLSRTWY